jgi:hypothetical protein
MSLRSSGRLAAAAAAVATMLSAVPAAGAQSLPITPNGRLAAAVNRYELALGYTRDATPAIERAALPGTVADRFTGVLDQLYQCDVITRTNLNAVVSLFSAGLPEGQPPVSSSGTQTAGSGTVLGVSVGDPPNPQLPQTFPFEDAVRSCGQATVTKLDALRVELKRNPVRSSSSIDLWPVLRFKPGTRADTYVHDYVLLVDTSAGNTFLNNAGGNALDVWRGPSGSGAKIVAPARGCIDAFDIIRERTCELASAALLATGGNNHFGRLEAPDPATDGQCTNDPVARRIFTQGTGNGGVGVLIDEGSNNTFVGKVITTGAGMIGGYGYLRTDGDDNTYKVIRTGLGAGIVAGIGTLIANGDHNTYSYYVPAAKDPQAQAGTLGSGGVVNDLNQCDAGSSHTLGSGAVGAVGVFQADGVGNSYTAPVESLGSGIVGGKGTFIQTGAGNDTYAGPGATGRGNNVTVLPTSTDNGTFIDK